MSAVEELFPLLHQLVEGQLDDHGQARLNHLLRTDPALIDVYSDYMMIHAQLFWDAGLCGASANAQDAPKHQVTYSKPVADQVPVRRTQSQLIALAASLVAIVGLWFAWGPENHSNHEIAGVPDQGSLQQSVNSTNSESHNTAIAGDDGPSAIDGDLKPLQINRVASSDHKQQTDNSVEMAVNDGNASSAELLAAEFTDADVSAKIDSLLAVRWAEHNVTPSASASDLEWVRRAYLTYVGRIPTLAETEQFASWQSARKYSALVDQLSDTPERAANLASVWTNLLIGRTEKRGVNREKLFEYLTNSFRTNQPWIDVVGELVTATGRNDQNGATNFLLAHLNNQATPATAVTAKLFLGEQISCVQCNDHPFAKELHQQDYWALNAFFKDTDRVSVSLAMTDDSQDAMSKDIAWKLVDRRRPDRMTYFETRYGMEKAVLPRYDSTTLPESSDANRRQELARLLATDSTHKVARAMVNRMWAHFYGFGFTPEVDDMGSHATVSHPELLNLLTEAFVKSDYDIKRLMAWIGKSNAWHLSSEVTDQNLVDAPATGETPLFSRVYVRRMSPEQVYESIRVAIRSASDQPVGDVEADAAHRREWVAQFAQSYGTDENDESMDFDGTIAQAMVMMNGIDVDEAIHQATAAIVGGNKGRKPSTNEMLDKVALAMLTRKPTSGEKKIFTSHYRRQSTQPANAAVPTAVEDMMWAYLNSSEFVLVH